MKKIIDYIVVEEVLEEDHFENTVKSMIKAGWQPLGGIAIDPQNGEWTTCYQTMVKYEE